MLERIVECAVPYDKQELYDILTKTQKAKLATLRLFAMDGELPSYGEVVIYANAVEERVQRLVRGRREADAAALLDRSNAQDARERLTRDMEMTPGEAPPSTGPAVGRRLRGALTRKI